MASWVKSAQPPGSVCNLRRLGALALLLGQFTEGVAYTLQSHVVPVKIVAQREVGVGGPRLQADQVVHSSLHLDGIILTTWEVTAEMQSGAIRKDTVLAGPRN